MRDPGNTTPVEQPHSNHIPGFRRRRVDSMGVPQGKQPRGDKRVVIGYKWVTHDMGLGVPPKRVRVPVYGTPKQAMQRDPALNHPGGIDVPKGTHQPSQGYKPAPKAKPPTPKNDPSLNRKGGIDVPKNGVGGTHPGPTHNVAPNSAKGHPHGGVRPGGGGGNAPGGGGMGGLMTSLYSMLGQSNTQHMLPTSLADQAASPDTALAATLADQISRLPKAKRQALKNISDWYGQVQTAEKHGAARDQALANAGASSMTDTAKGIMASLGGSAMAGSGEVGAMGANDANTMKAIGANDASLANELAPIFKLSAASAKNTRAQQYDNQQLDLQDQRGQALGQADAARAAALMQILGANNSARQTNFGNTTGLLNTLAGLQISGMNAASQAQERGIMNALHVSEIRKNSQKSVGGLDALTPSERSGLATALNNLIMDPNSGQLKSGMSWPNALQDVRNYLRTQGLNPLNKRVVNQFVAPIMANAGIQFQNPNTLYRP